MSLKVVRIGLQATLEDGGRRGYLHLGVPQGGAFDQESLIDGNLILGNDPKAAGLEVTLLGGTFEAVSSCQVAVTGAPCGITINDQPVLAYRSLEMNPGDRLSLGACSEGVRTYICMRGGILAPKVLGSCSGTILSKDMLLTVDPNGANHSPIERHPVSFNLPIRLIPTCSTAIDDLHLLTTALYTVSSQSNRVGIRLNGPPLQPEFERMSEPIVIGTIQITNSGQPIMIGPDGPTIGGYRTIACVCREDWSRMGRLRPDEEVRFELLNGFSPCH